VISFTGASNSEIETLRRGVAELKISCSPPSPKPLSEGKGTREVWLSSRLNFFFLNIPTFVGEVAQIAQVNFTSENYVPEIALRQPYWQCEQDCSSKMESNFCSKRCDRRCIPKRNGNKLTSMIDVSRSRLAKN